LPARFAALVRTQTSGNPLFLLNACEDFVQRGWLQEIDGAWECTVDLGVLESAVPAGTREMIAFRLDQLAATRRELLEAASAIGTQFTTQALAAALAQSPAEAEAQCVPLVREAQLLKEVGAIAWPDGTRGMQYEFRHALYRQTLYDRLTPA